MGPGGQSFVGGSGDAGVIVNGSTREAALVVDLGSGDGRIVIAAAKEYGARSIGYEIDPQLVQLARENVRLENLEQLVHVAHEDIYTLDFGRADVLTVYLPSPLLERLLPQFGRLKPGARIVSHPFEIPGVPPDQSLVMHSAEDGDQHRFFLSVAPLRNAEPWDRPVMEPSETANTAGGRARRVGKKTICWVNIMNNTRSRKRVSAG